MISLLIALVILGAALYLLQLLPIDATVKQIIQVIAIVFIVIWAIRTLLPAAGLH
jgi:hypothetical protein